MVYLDWKVSRITMYMGFLIAILLMSSIYTFAMGYENINKISDVKGNPNPVVTPGKYYNNNITNGSIISSNITANSDPEILASMSLGAIEGQVFEDLNANGARDIEQAGLAGDEVIMPGWQIKLKGKDIANRPVNITTITDSNGNYYFSGLTAGNYVVIEELPSDWVQTSPLSLYNIAIANGSEIYGQDFGNFHKGKIIGGSTTVGRKKYQKIETKFGIIAESGPCNPHCLAKGRVEYQDNSTSMNIESIQINTVSTTLDKRKGVITGLAKVNGRGSYSFIVYVEDDSDNDLFDISVPTYKYSNRVIMNEGSITIR